MCMCAQNPNLMEMGLWGFMTIGMHRHALSLPHSLSLISTQTLQQLKTNKKIQHFSIAGQPLVWWSRQLDPTCLLCSLNPGLRNQKSILGTCACMPEIPKERRLWTRDCRVIMPHRGAFLHALSTPGKHMHPLAN